MSEHLVYRMFDADGVCLYAGMTANLTQRYKWHHAFTYGRLTTLIEYTTHPDKAAARAAEIRTIRALQPLFCGLDLGPYRKQTNDRAQAYGMALRSAGVVKALRGRARVVMPPTVCIDDQPDRVNARYVAEVAA